MKPKDLIRRYKNQVRAGRELGFTGQCVGKWVKAGRIPIRSQIVIESITGGALKADKK